MKVLLRSDYAWHEAKWNTISKGFTVDDDVNVINQIGILSVKDDDRNKYVICPNCGETILNTPSAIKKHRQLSETSDTCLSCRYCRKSNVKKLHEKFTENSDGTYEVTTKENAKLTCGYTCWGDRDINSENVRQRCIYKDCKTAEFTAYKDVFSQYPGIFDDILTVDVLAKKKWLLVNRLSNGTNIFKIPIHFNLHAIVNKYGFIDRFYYMYRNSKFEFMYSPKYSKIIWMNWNGYTEEKPSYNISDTVIDKITKKIKELYKEADTNE